MVLGSEGKRQLTKNGHQQTTRAMASHATAKCSLHFLFVWARGIRVALAAQERVLHHLQSLGLQNYLIDFHACVTNCAHEYELPVLCTLVTASLQIAQISWCILMAKSLSCRYRMDLLLIADSVCGCSMQSCLTQ